MLIKGGTAIIRKAKITDVPKIKKLIDLFSRRREMLPRSLNELYENLRDFWIYEEDGKVIACGALHTSWEDLAEIKSLAVSKEKQKQGVGSKLIKSCLDEALDLGIKKIFALTYKPGFFQKEGFQLIEKDQLPHKIWNECIKCPHFPDCQEVPLIYEIS